MNAFCQAIEEYCEGNPAKGLYKELHECFKNGYELLEKLKASGGGNSLDVTPVNATHNYDMVILLTTAYVPG